MDLEYGPEYEEYKIEVQAFCNKYKGIQFTKDPPIQKAGGGVIQGNRATLVSERGPEMSRSEWQKNSH